VVYVLKIISKQDHSIPWNSMVWRGIV